jgi:16S rRNA (cytidine1402-2'-O)-methyltransferase
MTPRAVEALRSASLVACEDTRRTRALLTHFGLSVPTVSCHKFNEAARVREILGALGEGRTVALVTDAGTPGVSDPGARLVEAAAREGIPVEAIPGPSAPAAAMSISGFEAGGFVFAGFAPSRSAARRRFFRALAASEEARHAADPGGVAWPTILFEAPHRIAACLEDLRAEIGERRVVVIREMTKMHEEVLRGSASEVLAALAERPRRGEFTIVIEGRSEWRIPAPPGGLDLKSAYEELIASGVDRREALRRLAKSSGSRRRDVYRAVAGLATDSEE